MQFCLGRTGVVVRTENGLVHGTVSLSRSRREFYSWRGIPYAEPPVGKLRFEDPVPARSWNGTFSAMNYGPPCTQIYGGILPIGKEDCLTLNVFAPADAFDRESPMPVMIFIHGGVFAILCAQYFSPDYFMDEDVVLVTLNYRLDVFGFLSTGDSVVRGNMGLKDQSMAMRWIRNNIDAFGGDHSKVTIFGQSAGAASVHFHMLSPMSRGLFDRAISQSGTATAPRALNENPVEQAKKFAKNLGCSTKSYEELVGCFRTRSIGEILALRFRAHLRTWIDGIWHRQSESGVGHYDEMYMLTPLTSLYYIGKHHHDFEFSKDVVKLWVSFASGSQNLSFRCLEFAPVQQSGNPVLFQMDDEPRRVSLDVEKRIALWNEFYRN